MDLPTYTSIWRIEKRLYKLYDFRLPMPVPVGQIAVFAAITVPYVIILTVLGLPFSHTLFWLYVLPPGVLTWLATRPVLESKRLPELIISQVRYLGEPATWCRMSPLAEKDEVVVVGRVWRRAAEQEPVTAPAPAPAPARRPVPVRARPAHGRGSGRGPGYRRAGHRPGGRPGGAASGPAWPGRAARASPARRPVTRGRPVRAGWPVPGAGSRLAGTRRSVRRAVPAGRIRAAGHGRPGCAVRSGDRCPGRPAGGSGAARIVGPARPGG